ncbi:MAG: rhomboid family intramembrane serine protease [Alphaproteobacteria bacterium]|nr:rhomboid family intramembrane serine protease [Alphaproteobacteria bacterium]
MPFMPIHDDNERTRIETPVVTWGAILVCAVVFMWQAGLPEAEEYHRLLALGFVPGRLLGPLQLHPDLVILPAPLSLVTTQFLHGDFAHLLGNMAYLYIFGDNVEDAMGHLRFAVFFLLCGILAALAHGLTEPSSAVPLIGASGAISGILGAHLVLKPRARILVLLFVAPLRLPAWMLVVGWFAVQCFFGLSTFGTDGPVAYWAHIGGFAAGIALLPLFRGVAPRRGGAG